MLSDDLVSLFSLAQPRGLQALPLTSSGMGGRIAPRGQSMFRVEFSASAELTNLGVIWVCSQFILPDPSLSTESLFALLFWYLTCGPP